MEMSVNSDSITIVVCQYNLVIFGKKEALIKVKIISSIYLM